MPFMMMMMQLGAPGTGQCPDDVSSALGWRYWTKSAPSSREECTRYRAGQQPLQPQGVKVGRRGARESSCLLRDEWRTTTASTPLPPRLLGIPCFYLIALGSAFARPRRNLRAKTCALECMRWLVRGARRDNECAKVIGYARLLIWRDVINEITRPWSWRCYLKGQVRGSASRVKALLCEASGNRITIESI